MILQTGQFNVSVLTQSAPFALFQRFGFQSGRTADKFAGLAFQRSANGLAYLAEHANAFFSAQVVVDALDYGTPHPVHRRGDRGCGTVERALA